MTVLGLNHVGTLTEDLGRVRSVFGELLGFEGCGPDTHPRGPVGTPWGTVGGVVRPPYPDGEVATFIRSGQRGVHHVALTVTEAALEAMRAEGVALLDEVSRPETDDACIGFVGPSSTEQSPVELTSA
jgi:hypothetical protein